MNEIQNRNVLSTNEAVARSKLEGIPIAETALRRWIKDGTLKVAYSGKKALIYWPNVVKLLCGESAEDKCVTNCTIEAKVHSANC